MKENHVLWIILVAGLLLIILNFVFTADKMESGFWLRIASSVLVALAMIFTLRGRKKN